jgi:hypothetical protein
MKLSAKQKEYLINILRTNFEYETRDICNEIIQICEALELDKNKTQEMKDDLKYEHEKHYNTIQQ